MFLNQRWSRSHGAEPRVHRLDVYNDVEHAVDLPTSHGEAWFFTDRKGNVRVITSRDARGELFVQTKPADGD